MLQLQIAVVSRRAADFADTAKAFVFCADGRTGRLGGLNSRAREARLPDTHPAGQDLDPW
ncbi:hypothetical protein [Streptomyces sp. LN704]|uniref:hypothetical protein n=1 Tax=unclassified Streptomyces TaxID=2593676 RepID=UPI00372286FC